MDSVSVVRVTDEEALALHAEGRPGKLQIVPTKPLTTARDLSLAYSPGVAAPCRRIQANPDTVYDYTARGNIVAVISNGTAVLGLGNIGALASKPVMEGKAVLLKRFADIDGVDLEVDTQDVEAFINCVRFLGPSFGGINLEDIKAPECFIIEKRLKELMDIPVFHDDQHGTAIIAAAGLLNALDVTGRSIQDARVVMNGAGAAAVACANLFKSFGLPQANLIMCDTKGVVYEGRTEHMNAWKAGHAVATDARTLEDALKGADVFVGLSAKGCVTPAMIRSMNPRPIVFAMANPDPEISPEDVKSVAPDAVVATGRSDYPNQINNVLGFPYIFRGALDVRASTINEEMKQAAARALAALAREDVPDEVRAAYGERRRLRYGPDYIIPVPFDPRLITRIPLAVANAAMQTGVARKPLTDQDAYRRTLQARLDPTANRLERMFAAVRERPRRVVFAEGEDIRTIQAALRFQAEGYGTPILVGNEEVIRSRMQGLKMTASTPIAIHNAQLSPHSLTYRAALYERLCRRGFLDRDCRRLVNHNRNVLAASMLIHGEADAMVTGLTRSFATSYEDVSNVIDGHTPAGIFGLSIMMMEGRTLFLSDTAVQTAPPALGLAEIAISTARWAKRLGHVPRVAFLASSTFGHPDASCGEASREAVRLLDQRGEVGFEYDGEMGADVALDFPLMKRLYPFCRLTGPANVLIMPNRETAQIASKLLAHSTGVALIGPVLDGFDKPVQILRPDATASDVVTAAVLAAWQVEG